MLAVDTAETRDRAGTRRWLLPGLKLLAAALVLAAGFGLALSAYYLIALRSGSVDADGASLLQVGLANYFRLIFWKGLLPQLVLAHALFAIGTRANSAWFEARWRRAAGLAAGALVAYAVVAPLLLTREFAGWPALQMVEPADHVGTALLMTGAVTLAAWIAGAIRSRRAVGA